MSAAHRSSGRICVHSAVAIALLTATAVHAAAAKGPVVKIEETRVTASSVSPGSDVAFLSVGLATDGYHSLVVRTQTIVSDADRDGAATLEQPDRVPWRSIWIVADVKNGQFTVAGPEGYSPNLLDGIPVLRKSKGADVDEIVVRHPAAFLYYIHANGGVWELTARDGDSRDADRAANGVITVRLSDFSPIGPAKDKPKGLSPGGVLIVLDYYEMDVLAVKLDGGMLNGGGK